MTVNENTFAELDTEARQDAPRLFAVYGVRKRRRSEDDDGGFVR